VPNLTTAPCTRAAGAARPAPMPRHTCLQKAPSRSLLPLSRARAFPPSIFLDQPSAAVATGCRRHRRPSFCHRYGFRCYAQLSAKLCTPPPPSRFPRCPARARRAWSHRLRRCRHADARACRRCTWPARCWSSPATLWAPAGAAGRPESLRPVCLRRHAPLRRESAGALLLCSVSAYEEEEG